MDDLRTRYGQLIHQTTQCLRRQVGDAMRIREHRDTVLRFRLALASSSAVDELPPGEIHLMQSSIAVMIRDLDVAHDRSADAPDVDAFNPVQYVRNRGGRGRPRILIDRIWLAEALRLRGPTGIAPSLGCSARQVRKEAIRHGLVERGTAVYTQTVNIDGSVMRNYRSSTAAFSDISDDDLDAQVASILESFPSYGRAMVTGELGRRGLRIQRERVRASYERVHGAPRVWGARRIERRPYKVAGPNSLWHHDGQHGLIKYKIVIHGFIDGFSRLITGMRARDNNRAATVAATFHEARQKYGTPRRVRGDHGTENLMVAEWMFQHRGGIGGAYIWGRSIHNTRIERLWVDVTNAFGRKWKRFFRELEEFERLVPTLSSHTWLLHHLFLPAINQDIQEFVEAWNFHRMQLTGERSCCPREMFFFGMQSQGRRGLDEIVTDLNTYGVDFEDLTDPGFVQHLHHEHPEEGADIHDFDPPERPPHVICEPPNSPLTAEGISHLDGELDRILGNEAMDSRDMTVRRTVWTTAFGIIMAMVQ